MIQKIRFQNKIITILIVVLAISTVIDFKSNKDKDEEIRMQEKINFELQAEYDKVLSQNDYYRQHVKDLEQKNKDLEDKLNRVLTISSGPIERVERVISSETRGSTLLDAVASTQTVLDRSTGWGMTATEVINQPGQYSAPYRGPIPDKVKLAFELVYLDGYRAFPELTTHFHADYVSPSWSRGKAFRGKISDHKYYGPEG
jgi:spore germination cell wall hydrolase CwlJ-like protein